MDVYSPLSFSIHWRIYPEQLDIKKRDTQNRKEVKKKIYLFTEDMIFYTANPKENTKKLSGLSLETCRVL